ncbi:hypothetical protein AS594_39490 [Streptomyces agglomeratus]|uniref:Uncharacterized protein n=1 Tax=Streptomyces agglomeratus TaxID=285458 RepID=A0A1E5NZ72_9ACTN|nr:hypothetical protein [Streptomyces agglomeratus]OEJ21613.1 hypothetical protein AS594_39490 [Streptomyces agglomeratus]
MSAPTPAGPATQGPGLQPPDFGRPSPALLAHADRGFARFLAPTTPAAPDDRTGDHDQDDAARQR